MLAPSSHNTQPWLFRMAESSIDLFADRTRALPVNDPDDRELTISCGCALMHLRIAAAMVSEGDAVQWANPSWRRELAAWMHPRRLGDGFGVPGLAARPVGRAFLRHGRRSRSKGQGAGGSVSATRGAGNGQRWGARLADCRAGAATRFATRMPAWIASFVLESTDSARLLANQAACADSNGMPQVLLRLGYPANALPPVPRRPVSDVIVQEGTTLLHR
ncbi:hypothetical protein [Massilia sp. BSC265]|uniref:hypothetical protein n=1 Tax=Massilia sp. BSC265 TaxID=1549812 RepID=UPI001E410998|nr:hypothetical protein [Massilia sp. BSC265]